MTESILEKNNSCVDKAYKILQENKIYPEVWCDSNLQFIYVQIDNGDWKHEHMFTKNLLEENHFQFVSTQEIGDSEDDTYSAVHKFMCLGAWGC